MEKIPSEKERFSSFFLIAVPFLTYFYLLARKIDLTTADLGRHLKNGEFFWRDFSLVTRNFYSYTFPDYPFLNHHWLAGLFFYFLKTFFGFLGLHLFFILLSLLTLAVFFKLGKEFSSLKIASFTSFLSLPLLASRREIRPEVFSYFFSALVFYLLVKFRRGQIKKGWLFFLPLIQLLWVNLHLYFFLGLFLLFVFLLESLIKEQREKNQVLGSQGKILIFVFCLSILASLINPFGFQGLLYPLFVYENYGYRVFEEQSLWFIEKLTKYPPGLYFKILFFFLLVSWLFIFLKKKKFSFSFFLLSLFFSVSAWLMLRNIALFGYFASFFLAVNLTPWKKIHLWLEGCPPFFLMAGVSLFLFLLSPSFWRLEGFGLGLEREKDQAIEFFQREHLRGPIFNNYDIGGYLIYYLFPKERVFVDNRPAAYPASFFRQVYIPMQEKEKKWQEEEKKFGFNVIFFYRHDFTPWAQKFLIQRVKDKEWAPVFVDEEKIIFLKRKEENARIIQKYEIPPEWFVVVP